MQDRPEWCIQAILVVPMRTASTARGEQQEEVGEQVGAIGTRQREEVEEKQRERDCRDIARSGQVCIMSRAHLKKTVIHCSSAEKALGDRVPTLTLSSTSCRSPDQRTTFLPAGCAGSIEFVSARRIRRTLSSSEGRMQMFPSTHAAQFSVGASSTGCGGRHLGEDGESGSWTAGLKLISPETAHGGTTSARTGIRFRMTSERNGTNSPSHCSADMHQPL